MIRDTDVTRAILDHYHRRLAGALESDVLVAGAGPSGLVAATLLAEKGLNVSVCEKRLAPGGGVWAGGMFMNAVVLQPEAKEILERLGVPAEQTPAGLLAADAVRLASALTLRALEAGALILNALAVEDLLIDGERVRGLVLNRPSVEAARLPVDPLTFRARAVLDATGHEAALVNDLVRLRRPLFTETGGMAGEGPMNAETAETFVVEKTGEIFPGLYVSGMAVQATHGGPRMGPIFGGMLLSGQKAARLIAEDLDKRRDAS